MAHMNFFQFLTNKFFLFRLHESNQKKGVW